MNDSFQDKLSEFVSTTLSNDKLSDIREILRNIAEAVEADGCILWESESFANIGGNNPTGNLYVSAKWFKDIDMPLHTMPINESANGYAILNQVSIEIENYQTDKLTYKKHDYSMNIAKLTSMYVVPLSFDNDNEKKNAALAVYRRNDVNQFNTEQQQFIETSANLLAKIYQSVCDKFSKSLLSKINQKLDIIEKKAKNIEGSTLSIEEQLEKIKNSLNEICHIIADEFQCVETSLFFENRLEKEDVFKLFGTNFKDWTTKKDFYLPQKSEGLTAWTLEEKKPIRIFNLLTFYQYLDEIREQYSDVRWNDSLGFTTGYQNKLKEILNLEPESELPALSFMAVPIIINEKRIGVIRCCTARESPWFFLNRQLEILELLVVPISRFWDDFIIHLEDEKETESWKNLIEKINSLNKRVQGNIDRLDFNETTVYDEILKITQQTFDKDDIFDIRSFNDNDELYFARTLGSAWENGNKIDKEHRYNKTFSKNSNKKIFAFEVIKTGNVKFVTDVKKEYGKDTETFPQTRQIIIAPIGLANKNIGVLDIRRTTDNPFPPNAPIMTELIGRQLGLYLELWETEKQQRRVFEDTWHQLKGTVRYNFARATALLDHECFEKEPYTIDEETAKEISDELSPFRGLARKSKRVLENAGMFTELATTGQLKPIKVGIKLTKHILSKMCYEIAEDTKLMLEDYRNIRFIRRLETFGKLDNIKITVNTDYLEQALNCLIDNAGKYSYTDTRVYISCGEDPKEGKRYFYIAVENLGLEISDSEQDTLKKRKTRGEWAKSTTGEGSGIGLWITDHIMKAHGGKLIITPTNPKGITVVKLLFPISI